MAENAKTWCSTEHKGLPRPAARTCGRPPSFGLAPRPPLRCVVMSGSTASAASEREVVLLDC